MSLKLFPPQGIQTEFPVSSLKSLNLACLGELALSTMIYSSCIKSRWLLSVGRLNAASCVESRQYCWPPRSQGQGLEEDGAGRKISSYILWQAISWMQFSLTGVECLCASVCTIYISLYGFFVLVSLFMWVKVCISSRSGSQQDPWLRDSFPSGLDKGNRWVSLKCVLSLESPCFSPATLPPTSPPLQPLHPP